ncbi:MAG: sulfotransferase family 2 domain-containing protein [Bacteroidia bacterium]|nr:sulfotransferase family 2 domain-containing protein [Bacteroidia bacterium]
MNQRKFICFIHIEKCGGITLHHLIQNNLPFYVNLRSWYYWSNEPGKYFTKDDLLDLSRYLPFIQGIGGHTTRVFAEYEEAIENSIIYLSFLRDPIQRYMSHINYQRQVMGINWDISDFISDNRFDNYQTVRLAGSEDVLEAKRILNKKIDFVGIVEEFDVSLLLLKNSYPEIFWNVQYERKNTTEVKKSTLNFKELDKDIQNKIVYNNRLDIELYHYAKEEIFNVNKMKYKGDIDNDLEYFKRKNETYRYPFFKSKLLLLYRNIMRYILQPIFNRSMRKRIN